VTKSVNVPTRLLEDIQILYKDTQDAGYGEQDGMAVVETLLNV
jgi:3-hydroxyisobutyrate dehydrogenase-like beta-hydroxyacid dehydrogenase